MKVIDLLNKIANGEEVPKKIKFNEYIYTYHDKEHGYCKHHYDNTYICMNSEYYLFDILNDEVEVIEEDKKIEHYYFSVFQDERLGGRQVVESLESKINEIIDTINEMREDK